MSRYLTNNSNKVKLTLLFCSLFLSINSIFAQNHFEFYGNIGVNYTRLQLTPEYHSNMAGAMRSTGIVENYIFNPIPTIGIGFNTNQMRFKGKIGGELSFNYINGESDYYYYFYGKETDGKLYYDFYNFNIRPTFQFPIKDKLVLKTGISFNYIFNNTSYFEGTRKIYYDVHNLPFAEPIIYNANQTKSLPNKNYGIMLGFIYQLNKKIELYINYDIRTSRLYNRQVYPAESMNVQSVNIGLNYFFPTYLIEE